MADRSSGPRPSEPQPVQLPPGLGLLGTLQGRPSLRGGDVLAVLSRSLQAPTQEERDRILLTFATQQAGFPPSEVDKILATQHGSLLEQLRAGGPLYGSLYGQLGLTALLRSAMLRTLSLPRLLGLFRPPVFSAALGAGPVFGHRINLPVTPAPPVRVRTVGPTNRAVVEPLPSSSLSGFSVPEILRMIQPGSFHQPGSSEAGPLETGPSGNGGPR